MVRHEVGECQDCRWWEEYQASSGACARVMQEPSKAFISPDQDSLCTDCDFGCVQWEAKPNEG